jgi:hypothetical protein
MMRRSILAVLCLLSSQLALGDDWQPAMAPAQQPNPYAAAWPPPGASMGQPAYLAGPSTTTTSTLLGQPVYPTTNPPASTTGPFATNPGAYDASRTNWGVPPPSSAPPPVVAAVPAPLVSPHESTWYFRQETFHWNERSGGVDFVNEYGPISTLGYLHRSGIERFRFELFGGTVAYYGGAQYQDDQGQWQSEALHESNGTNYLGCRGEYDLLIEPATLSNLRFVLGVGNRFWVRDLQDTATPDLFVSGYQEFWWTFYPYIGLETRNTDQPGLQFLGSARVGFTPLNFQYATLTDPDYPRAGSVVYPRCGFTAQAQLGVTYHRFSATAYVEWFTWGESAVVGDSYQPASQMLTIGAQIGYTF